jgi:hypothetical protein
MAGSAGGAPPTMAKAKPDKGMTARQRASEMREVIMNFPENSEFNRESPIFSADLQLF